LRRRPRPKLGCGAKEGRKKRNKETKKKERNKEERKKDNTFWTKW
jgi:hypothetical protein